MADTLKRYFNGYIAASGGTDSTLVTAGSSGAVIRHILLCNTDTTDRTVNISIGTTAYDASKAFYSAFTVPASGIHVANVNIVLTNGEKVFANASIASKVVATISGVDL